MLFKNDKVYDVLVYIAQIVLPALAVLYAALASKNGIPSLFAKSSASFVGTFLRFSSKSHLLPTNIALNTSFFFLLVSFSYFFLTSLKDSISSIEYTNKNPEPKFIHVSIMDW